ncbi:MAG: IS110 family transposase [Coriobacteriia bacterium]|nr:IS110 family transposase [Coriobacteriia bacterium]
MHSDSITWVGMDAHKNSIKVSAFFAGRPEPQEWQEQTTPEAIRRLCRKLKRNAPGEVRCCYEAGPTGYALQRQLQAGGVTCTVIAPSMTPVKPGTRIKTDRRDARKLAELLRAGLLTEVHPPSESDEALRDLCRCRDDVRIDLMRSRHRLGKFLLRRHLIYRETKHHWGTRHWAWLERLRFDDPVSQATFDSYMLAVQQLEERLRQLDTELAEFGGQDPYREPVAWLRCFKGIDTVTAVCLVAELHDFRRFRTPRELMSYVGLVPSECSSGEHERRGGITKTGNRHVRRLLVEAAWHHRHRPTLSAPLKRRREGQPARVLAIADRAQERLAARYRRMTGRGVAPPKTIVAMARELAGYIWAALQPAAGAPRS